MKTFRNLAACALMLTFTACAGRTGAGSVVGLELPAAGDGAGVFQTGVASWYGDDFAGKATANGEIYDMHKLTAAHQNLPFHTLVEVENLENQKKVLVRINDRGPFLKDRIIDLALLAAQRLGMADKGTAQVSLRVLRWGGAAPDGIAFLEGSRECYVQAGAFSQKANAEDALLTLGEIFPDLVFRIAVEDSLFKIISGRLSAAPDCREVLAKLAAYHLPGFIRDTDIAPD